MKYSFLRNRRGYLFHIYLLLAFVFALLPSRAFSWECSVDATCIQIVGYSYQIAGPQWEKWPTGDMTGCLNNLGWDSDYETSLPNPYANVILKYYYGGGTVWRFISQTSYETASPEYPVQTVGYDLYTNLLLGTTCGDWVETVPCDDYVTEPDTDSDGICDRCDYEPNDSDIGTNVYLIWEYEFDSTIIAQEYSIIPPNELITLPDDIIPNYTYTASLGDPDSDIDLTGTTTYIRFDSQPAATMQPCACDTPCTLTTTPGSGMTSGDYEYTGTESDPETPPTITLEGSTVERNFLTPDQTGEHGTTTTGTDAPGSGSTDNEFLESIANNQDTAADNLDTLGNILDAELNEINANTARTAGNVADLKDAIEDQYIDDVMGTSDATYLLTSAGDEIETLSDGLIASIVADVTEQAENSLFTTSFFDGVVEEFTSIFTSGECVDLDYYIPSLDKTVTLTCEFSEKFKTIFGFMVAIYTIMTLIDILFTGIVPKGTAPVGLFTGSKVD